MIFCKKKKKKYLHEPYPRPSAAKQSPKQYTQIRVEINVYKTHVPSNYILFPGGCEGDSELILLNKSH